MVDLIGKMNKKGYMNWSAFIFCLILGISVLKDNNNYGWIIIGICLVNLVFAIVITYTNKITK